MTVKWSHSALKKYELCPRQYHETIVLKNYPFTDTQATLYGKEYHTAAELYIKEDKPLPPQFEFTKELLDALNVQRAHVVGLSMGAFATLHFGMRYALNAQTGRAMKQHMVQCLAADFSCFNENHQVFNQLWLAAKLRNGCRPNGVFKLPFGGILVVAIGIQIRIAHDLELQM